MNEFHVDGYTVGSNPSEFGGGFTVFKNGVLLNTNPVHKYAFTNNEAELLAMHSACLQADKGDRIVTDSQNTMSWIANGKSKARPDLNLMCLECKNLIHRKFLKVVWKPRDYNLAGKYNETVIKKLPSTDIHSPIC